MLTEKQKELVALLKGALPTAPAEIAQEHVNWYRHWTVGEALAVGDRVSYNEILWEVIQAHTTQADWTPDTVPALFKRVYTEAETDDGYTEWVQPTGAHDAYAKGAKVRHSEKKWTSDIDANVWEPGVYGWTEVTEETEAADNGSDS